MAKRTLKIMMMLTGLVAASSSSPVFAASAKAKRVAKTAAVKPAPQTSKAPERKLSPKAAPLQELKLVEGDEQGNEVKALKAELLVSKSEENAIAQAQKLLKKHQGTPLEPGLHFRLAELYMRRSKTDRFFEVHRESDTIVKLAPRPVKEASSRGSVLKAAETYSLLQHKFPSYEQMDIVVYNHAFARQILGQEKEAEQLYWMLISRFSRSPLVPEAHLAIGEIAFNRNQFKVALDQFDAIRKYPRSRVYPYGLYKAAWTHYNLRDAQSGLRKLEEVVEYGRAISADNRSESRLDLRKEALNDMTIFFEDVYPSKDAYAYFTKQAGSKEAGPIILRMATLYERHSRFNDQRVVLEKFLEELPRSPLVPQVQNDLVLAHDQLRQKDKSVEHLEQLATVCKADGPWVRAQGKTAEETKKAADSCSALVTETSLRVAKKWLKAWKKLPSDTTYADASERAYEIYLRVPADTDDYRQSHYAYAELLFARQKFRKASSEYAKVAQSGGSGSALQQPGAGAQLAHDAAYGAIVALEKAVGTDKWSNDDEKGFHALAEAYLTRNPKGQYRLDIQYKMALLAYEKERYDEAAPMFLKIGREFPGEEKGQKAQDLYLDILNIKKDYRGIRDYAMELIKRKPDPAREGKMRKLYEQAYFLEVQGMEEKGRLEDALREYVAFAKQNPESDLSEKATWNAMSLHFKLGDNWNGARTAEEFADRYPKSDKAINALLSAAQNYEQMAQLKEGARVLDKLAARDAKGAARWKELAADFHALDGEAATARKAYGELKAVGDSAQRVKILTKLEALEKSYGTPASHAEALKVMIDMNVQPQANEAKVAMVERDLAAGKVTDAFNDARRLLGAGMNAGHKARLRLVQAKILEQEFQKSSVKARAERVATVLAIKTEKLQKAQEALQSAIKYGDAAVSAECFERLYGLYASYVKALKEMPTPTGLTAADAQAFRAEIDNLVVPLEEKSVDTLAQAVKFSRQQQFIDGRSGRLEAELNRLNHQTDVKLMPEIEKPEMALPVLAGVGS